MSLSTLLLTESRLVLEPWKRRVRIEVASSAPYHGKSRHTQLVGLYKVRHMNSLTACRPPPWFSGRGREVEDNDEDVVENETDGKKRIQSNVCSTEGGGGEGGGERKGRNGAERSGEERLSWAHAFWEARPSPLGLSDVSSRSRVARRIFVSSSKPAAACQA